MNPQCVNILSQAHTFPSFPPCRFHRPQQGFFCEELLISGSVSEDLARSLPAPWPTVSGCPGIWVQGTLEAMSLEMELPVDGDACSKLHFCSEEHDLNPHFTLSEEQEESRSCIRHRQAETLFCKQTLLNDVLFDATGGNCACDRVDQSHSSISSHIPELCLSLTDSVDDAFHINSVNRNLVCVKDKNPFVSTIYCLHNTGFQFVTNFVCLVYFEFFKSYFNIMA